MIKASYEALQPASGQSFLIRTFDRSGFDAPYHFHPEYELTCIINGHGKRYIGSNMGDFITGDLVLVGPNLPHCWKLDNSEELQTEAGAIVIQFDGGFLGDDFFDRAELQGIKKLFERSSNGVCFNSATQTEVDKSLRLLSNQQDNFRTLMLLLEILQRLATAAGYTLLDQNRLTAERSLADQQRINPVLAYLVENFRQHVSLDVAAGIANMTPNAFCKYFKKLTRKTFMETIIEYRLNYAVQQLVQTDKAIAIISYESGFRDISHFHKMFKEKMKLSPLNYRKRFLGNL